MSKRKQKMKMQKKYPPTSTDAERRHAVFSSQHPFIIHGTDLKPFYPTHTHGLSDLNMPEMLFDPLAFGAEGNTRRLIDAYNYLTQPENKDILELLKNGAILTLTPKALWPNSQKEHPYKYCLKKVEPEFEIVKLAYYPEEITPDMWFVQMYVEGDDFALRDEYFRYGVKW